MTVHLHSWPPTLNSKELFSVSWVLGVVWTVTNVSFIIYHVGYSLPAKTRRNMQQTQIISDLNNSMETQESLSDEGDTKDDKVISDLTNE